MVAGSVHFRAALVRATQQKWPPTRMSRRLKISRNFRYRRFHATEHGKLLVSFSCFRVMFVHMALPGAHCGCNSEVALFGQSFTCDGARLPE
jgi:hypothetical protein